MKHAGHSSRFVLMRLAQPRLDVEHKVPMLEMQILIEISLVRRNLQEPSKIP